MENVKSEQNSETNGIGRFGNIFMPRYFHSPSLSLGEVLCVRRTLFQRSLAHCFSLVTVLPQKIHFVWLVLFHVHLPFVCL